jgi:hypothetical protein
VDLLDSALQEPCHRTFCSCWWAILQAKVVSWTGVLGWWRAEICYVTQVPEHAILCFLPELLGVWVMSMTYMDM